MSRKVYGKAFRISSVEAKAYRRVDRTVRPNPIGVTSMSAVNGRGAYARSARAVAAGKTRSQRIARAEEVYRNGDRKPMVLKNRKSTKRKSSRKRVSGTKYFRTKSGRYQNAKGKFVKAPTTKRRRKKTTGTKRRKTTAKRTVVRRKKRVSAVGATKRKTTRRRRVRRNASVGYSAAYAKGHARTFKKSKRRKAAAVAAPVKTRRRRRKSTAAVGATPKRSRSSARQKRAGRRLAAYSAAIRSGKSVAQARQSALRKVPLKQGDTFKGSARATVKVKGTTVRRNKRRRTEGAFVRNGSSRRKRAGRRLAAYRAALRQGKKKKTAKRAALRKVPLRRGDKFKGSAKAPVTVAGTKVRRNKRRKKVTANKRRRVSAVRRLKTNRRRTRAVSPNRRRRRLKAAVTPNRRRKMRRNGNTTVQNRRRRRSYRRNGSKGFQLFRRNSFMANLKAVFMTGLFVSTGFIAHRVLTNLLVDKALATTLADNTTFQTWKKPLAGLGVLGIGVAVSGAVAQKRAMELGAGMFASWLQSVIVSGLNAAQKPEWVAQIAGYSNSRAYMLRNGRRRRGLRGFSGERNAASIMPRYTPVGQYSQAAAGTSWTQATAGGRTLGEYYTATNSVQGVGEYFNATGEYFAPQGMKGVGSYEGAGQLAMQASAGVNHVIRDGIRPDSDLDQALDLAEAAAGVGEVPQINRVGQKSQWVPNGPLWAGERAVTDTQSTSEISAGILSRHGGNGILSGG